MKRREFIKNGTLAGAAILLPSSLVLAVGDELSDHRAVIESLAAYSDRVHPRLGDGEVHLVASIDRLSDFIDPDTLSRAFPYAGMRAEGNVISFTHRNTRYSIENVLPEHFHERNRALDSSPRETT